MSIESQPRRESRLARGPASEDAARATAPRRAESGARGVSVVAARAGRPPARKPDGEIGLFSNPLLFWGIAFEPVFAAALVYLPPLQDIFGTASLDGRYLLILAAFPFIVWGSDELRRWLLRRREPTEEVT